MNPDFSSLVKKSEAQHNEIDQEFSSFAEESEAQCNELRVMLTEMNTFWTGDDPLY